MNQGDVILTPVPQVDRRIKNRPAIILREMPSYGDLLVCGVSTQLHQCVKGFDEIIWLGTMAGGIYRYDGKGFINLTTKDGLAGNCVYSIGRDPNGRIWFGTDRGMTRYRWSSAIPNAYIVSVTTDQTYCDLDAIPAFTVGTRVTIEYSSIDMKTIPEKRQYRYRVYETGDLRPETSDSRPQTLDSGLKSHVSGLKSDVPYNPPTKETTFDWTPQEPGTYTFEVQAIDRDPLITHH